MTWLLQPVPLKHSATASGGDKGASGPKASRYTMLCTSRTAGPASPMTSCATSTNTNWPDPPDFSVTDWMREVRETASPTRRGARNSTLLDAHIRRGSGTGGRKLAGVSSRKGCPSGPSRAVAASGGHKHQWNPCGTKPSSGASRSNVASQRETIPASTRSVRTSSRPIHASHAPISSALRSGPWQ